MQPLKFLKQDIRGYRSLTAEFTTIQSRTERFRSRGRRGLASASNSGVLVSKRNGGDELTFPADCLLRDF